MEGVATPQSCPGECVTMRWDKCGGLYTSTHPASPCPVGQSSRLGDYFWGQGQLPGRPLLQELAGTCFPPAAPTPAWATVVAMATAWALLAREEL